MQSTRRKIASASLVVILGLMFVVPAINNSYGQPEVSSLVTSASANGEVSALSLLAQKIHGNFSSYGLSQGVLSVFGEISNDPSFVQAFLAHGQSSFSWGVGYDFRTGMTSDSNVGFNIAWNSSATSFTDSWIVFLSNGTIKGPTLSSSPLQEMTGCQAPSGDSCNWAGYQFYSGYALGSQNEITASTANIKVPTVSLAPAGTESVHSGNSVPMYVDSWIGISPNSGGGGGLVQTGFYKDANTTSSYVLWWELYPVNSGGSVQYTAGECSNSAVGTTSPGDILSLTITTYSSTWYFDTYDYNSTVSCSTSYSHSETPYYAQFIVEAPAYSSNLYISQIAKFSGPVNFEGAQVDIAYYGSTPDDVTNLYNNGWYSQSQLSQHTSNLNTQESYSTSTGTYYTSISGYPVVTWENSNYNWAYVGN